MRELSEVRCGIIKAPANGSRGGLYALDQRALLGDAWAQRRNRCCGGCRRSSRGGGIVESDFFKVFGIVQIVSRAIGGV